jgi:transposase
MDNKEKLALFRLHYIEKINNRPKGINIADACKRLGISFPTYYKWKRRLIETGKKGIDALFDRRQSGERHYKSLTKEQEDAIIEVITTHPEYGSQRISVALRENKDGKPYVSNGGVQKFLERRGLNLIRDRIKFAEEYLKAVKKENDKKIETVIFNRNQEEEVVLSRVVNL